MKSKMMKQSRRTAEWLAIALLAWNSGSAQSPAPNAGKGEISRAPQAIIDQHIDREWMKKNMLDLLDHWRTASVAPNGFIQENLDRQWKPWGEPAATLNGQSRQLFAMVEGYEYTKDKRYLDAVTKAYAFLMKMHDDQYGGFYNRTAPDGKVLDDTKSSSMSFTIFALANAYRVTKDPKYEKAAMDTYHVITTKMRNGEASFQGSMSRDFSGPKASPYAGVAHHTDIPDYGPAPGRGAGGRGRGGAGGHSLNVRMLAAFLQLYQATHSKEVWDEITSEMTLMAKVYDYDRGFMPDSFDADWKPVAGGEPSRPFEWAGTFSKAVGLGADPKFVELGSRSIDYGLKTDYNNAVGGSGGVDAQGRPTIMFWWAQCEVLKAFGRYAALHGRSDLWPYFDKTLAFVKSNYLDTEYGGWFEGMVPGWSRAKLAEVSERAYIKGAAEGAEFAAYHQTFMFTDLLAATQPH
jgi:mannose/cellobiose epimerase-like protein (N-acyl-D-glucosamine 2-epimerase family)